MFTGIIEELGNVVALEDQGDAVRLTVHGPLVTSDAGEGDSIAVNGCCLTVVSIEATQIGFDLLAETQAVTNLSDLRPGSIVNLERAMPANGRYGGHFVTGHIDATGIIRRWEQVGQDYELRVGIARRQGAYLVPKGCIAIDGISLTVAALDDRTGTFDVAVIPHTLAVTTLGPKQPGDPVNLEVDVLAKYVERLLQQGD